MPQHPLISAIIPTYNSSVFLPMAVASIRAQSVAVAAIIIVDDGSTDDTREVIHGLDAKVVYIRQLNGGPAAARNRGIAAAESELIAFLDADDTWTESKLERQLATLARHPELALVAGDMAEADRDGNVLELSVLARHGLKERFQRLDGAPIPNAAASLLQTNFIPTGTVLARTRVLREVGGFNPAIRYGEDLELWTRIAARHPIACLPEVLMMRRKHGANATSQTQQMHAGLVDVMRSLRECCGSELRKQGVDPDRIVASALNDLGYWHFDHGNLRAARKAFTEGLRERVTARGIAYRLATLLPAPVAYRLREAKQCLSDTRST